MLYLCCFIISLILLLIVMVYGRSLDINLIFLLMIVAFGNGGYYALSDSRTLEEALLATKLSYVSGIFAPMIVFFIICGICRVSIPKWMLAASFVMASALYLTVCTIGRTGLFYESAEFHTSAGGAYLDKTYGPMHTVYLIFMVLYTLSGIAVGLISLNRKNVVSRNNVNILLLTNAITVGVYMVERIVHLKVELLPVIFISASCIILIPLIRIYRYSPYNARESFEDKLQKTGYIMFDKKLRYMGCNDIARELFPELEEWGLEEAIPGNGGRFNTFLRQPLLNLIKNTDTDAIVDSTYEYKGETYRYQIGSLYSGGKRTIGYSIMVYDLTGVMNESKVRSNN